MYQFVKNIVFRLIRLLPVSSKYIFFESEIDFSENSRALYEYMISDPKYKGYRFVWKVQEPHKYPPRKNTVFVCWENPIQLNYYLSRCKYFIFTHPYWLKDWKKNQVVINSWHGNPFKAPPKILPSNVFDFMLASSEDGVRFRKKEFTGEFDVVVLGAPRSDYLLSAQYDQDYLAEFVDTTLFQKVIYCMPTYKKARNWTDGEHNNPYSINVVSNKEELRELNDILGQKQVLLVCIIHHLQVMDEMVTGQLSNIVYLRDDDYAAKGIVMNQMLRCADALVTDMSGVFLDYILLDRPIGFFVNDQKQYTRGFAMDNPEDYMPGQKMYSLKDFYSFIDDVCTERDDYFQFRKEVRDRVHKYQDDQNCRRFLEFFNI